MSYHPRMSESESSGDATAPWQPRLLEGIRDEATGESGYVVDIEQHGDSPAIFYCAIKADGGVRKWQIRTYLIEQISAYDPFDLDPYA